MDARPTDESRSRERSRRRDLNDLSPWHRNVRAADVASARRIASCWAQKMGINLAVAAVLGPNSNILDDAPARMSRVA